MNEYVRLNLGPCTQPYGCFGEFQPQGDVPRGNTADHGCVSEHDVMDLMPVAACGYAGIPKLDDANDAGTKASEDCTLILTEGDSAKALAVAGLSVVGRNRYGVFPLRCGQTSFCVCSPTMTRMGSASLAVWQSVSKTAAASNTCQHRVAPYLRRTWHGCGLHDSVHSACTAAQGKAAERAGCERVSDHQQCRDQQHQADHGPPVRQGQCAVMSMASGVFCCSLAGLPHRIPLCWIRGNCQVQQEPKCFMAGNEV